MVQTDWFLLLTIVLQRHLFPVCRGYPLKKLGKHSIIYKVFVKSRCGKQTPDFYHFTLRGEALL